jgi:acyl-CoA reductase-like NAD-dependent aldehyde dehydrogenase
MAQPFEITSPVDGLSRPAGLYLSLDEALDRLAAAEEAFALWRRTSVAERIALCLGFLNQLDARASEYAREVAEAMGKPVGQAVGEIGGARARTEALCRAAESALADVPLEKREGFTRFIRREPRGVVLDIAAWNYPYVVAVNVVIPALLAGNAVLLKHAPQTACVGRQFEEAFRAAGAPVGLVQNFMADHPTIEKVLNTGRLAHVGFTGSVRGGHEVYSRVAAGGFASCGLEMGGKDAALVLEDADIKKVVPILVDGAFYNAGQSCCAVERIYVPRKVHDEFVRLFVEETHKYKVGSPLDAATTLGPVVNREAAARIQTHLSDALTKGAKLVTQDAHFEVPQGSGCYLPPRVLTNVNHDMLVMMDESFGPIIGIQAYDDLEEGIRLVNDSPFGLTASIWTGDSSRALEIGDKLEVGTVYLNRCDAVDPELPWVGVKHSGLGFTLATDGIISMTRPKSFHLKHS